jgi:threonylcarbamoyladenosine tRNA methylthiotransferase MtaB
MSAPLRARGCTEVGGPDQADLIIVNTCTVTSRSDAKARASIRHLHKLNPSASIVVSGCSVVTQGDRIAALPGVDLTVGVNESRRFDRFLQKRGVGNDLEHSIKPVDPVVGNWCEGIDSFPGRSRAYLKIQDGCNNACSYCVIPSVRGKSRSRNPVDIVSEAGRLLAAGHTEIVLTGIHIGHYGRDLTETIDLKDLIRRLLDETDVSMLRLGSLNADEIDRDLLAMMASDPRIAKHLHIPLQSGSDGVLAKMARSYRAGGFIEVVERAVGMMPLINIGSDVIVGFPTEKDSDFDETFRVLEGLPMGYLHVFRYSDRIGTRASTMKKITSSEEITRRARKMKALGVLKKNEFLRSMIGSDLLSVRERVTGEEEILFRSTNYLKVYTRYNREDESPVVLNATGQVGDGLRGVLSGTAGGNREH